MCDGSAHSSGCVVNGSNVCILVCSQVMCTSQITVTFDLAHVVIYILWFVHVLITRHHPHTTVVIVCSTRVFMITLCGLCETIAYTITLA